jgi:uracil-DNA glycosylase
MPTKALPAAIATVIERLRHAHPDARYELDFSTPLELLVATILAAQCTDERVNRVTAGLFRKYRDASAYAEADPAALEEDVRPTGFYRNKAKAIQGACGELVRRFGGEVPRTMEELLTLPGVARKTANVVLTMAYGIPSGIIVDTHVARVAPRLGLTREQTPERIEEALMGLVPERDWIWFGPAMVLHGRYTCTAKAPQCGACPLADACEKRLEPGVTPADGGAAPGKEKSGGARAAARTTKPARVTTEGMPPLPTSWESVLAGETSQPYFEELSRFLAEERRDHTVFPPEDKVFSALELTPYDDVRVVLLGQDPYHDDGQAHGLCFSVLPGVPPPPSLVNIYKELQSDVGFRVPKGGYLARWAEQGVLMLNAVLTVRAHEPNSHKNRGWETFTDAILRKVADKREQVVFVLWGGYAQKKAKLVDRPGHVIMSSAHPSPLSARNGFFGSKPFSAINAALRQAGQPPIDWQIT